MKRDSNSQYKDKGVKGKALFEIFLVITLSFFISISFNTATVEAQETSCCTRAISGETCVSGITEDQCAEGYSPTGCENVPSCSSSGCCEFNRRCSFESSEASCPTDQGAVFTPGANCNELEQCQKRCCTIGQQCRLETAYQCEDVKGGIYNPNIQDETSCVNYCNQFSFGCCTESCTYGTGEGCDSFIEGVSCSRTSECGEECEEQSYTDCADDGHLYYYDSCGNQEGIAERCDPVGSSGPTTSCSDTDGDGRGDSCEKWDCDDVWDNPIADENGNCQYDQTGNLLNPGCFTDDNVVRRHGETWCQYQAAVGPGLDLPGTMHFKHSCIRGKEEVEPCNEDRSTICAYGEATSLVTGATESRAECISNKFAPCVDATTQTDCEAERNQCLWVQPEATAEIVETEDGMFNVTFFVIWQYASRDEPGDDWDFGDKGFVFPPEDEEEEPEFEDNENICQEGGCDSLMICPATGGADCEDPDDPERTPPGSIVLEFCDLNLDFNSEGVELRQNCPSPGTHIITSQSAPSEPGQAVRLYSTYVFSFLLPSGQYKMNIDNFGAGGILGESGDFNLPPLSLSAEAVEEYSKEINGKCLPLVPPAGDSQCQKASLLDDKRFVEATVWKDGFFGIGDLECESGCEFYNRNFMQGTNYLCNSYGDCGAGYNLAEEFSDKGYERDCDLGNNYENIQSECPIGSNNLREDEVDFSKLKFSGEGLKILQIPAEKFRYERGVTFGENLGAGALGGGIFASVIFSGAAVLGALIGAIAQFVTGFFSFIGGIGSSTEYYDIGTQCGAWERPRNGGEDCFKCHTLVSDGGLIPDVAFAEYNPEQGVPPPYTCTKRMCESLGSLCSHESTIEGNKCVIDDPNDVTPPLVVVENVEYECNDAAPGQVGGCSINSDGRLEILGEVKEFSSMNLTLKTIDPDPSSPNYNLAEFASCGFSTSPESSFDTIDQDFDEAGQLSKTHSLHIPNVGEEEEFNLFVYCRDASANTVEMETPFTVSFRSAPEPDLTPPIIRTFSPEEGKAFTSFARTSLDVELEINENVPNNAGCRWSKTPEIPFEDMEGAMQCTSRSLHQPPLCTGTIIDLELDDTPVYFKCKDTNGNVQQQDTPLGGYFIRRSGPLNITNLNCPHFENNACEGTIYDKNISLGFTTRGGPDGNGDSVCEYRINGGNYIEMFTTGENEHLQEGFTPGREGDFRIGFRCVDIAGNEARETIDLQFRIDSTAPRILNVFNIGETLHLRTSERAECSYASNESLILDGVMGGDGFIHDVSANTNLYRVRCKDRFENAGEFLNVYLTEK